MGVEMLIHILKLDTTWRCVGSFTPDIFISNEVAWIVGWVSPEAGLDAVEMRKISCLCPESNRTAERIV
jgi:hypothetical protein